MHSKSLNVSEKLLFCSKNPKHFLNKNAYYYYYILYRQHSIYIQVSHKLNSGLDLPKLIKVNTNKNRIFKMLGLVQNSFYQTNYKCLNNNTGQMRFCQDEEVKDNSKLTQDLDRTYLKPIRLSSTDINLNFNQILIKRHLVIPSPPWKTLQLPNQFYQNYNGKQCQQAEILLGFYYHKWNALMGINFESWCNDLDKYPISVRNYLEKKNVGNLFSNNNRQSQKSLNVFFPYRKSFLCYWLLPFLGFIHIEMTNPTNSGAFEENHSFLIEDKKIDRTLLFSKDKKQKHSKLSLNAHSSLNNIQRSNTFGERNSNPNPLVHNKMSNKTPLGERVWFNSVKAQHLCPENLCEIESVSIQNSSNFESPHFKQIDHLNLFQNLSGVLQNSKNFEQNSMNFDLKTEGFEISKEWKKKEEYFEYCNFYLKYLNLSFYLSNDQTVYDKSKIVNLFFAKTPFYRKNSTVLTNHHLFLQIQQKPKIFTGQSYLNLFKKKLVKQNKSYFSNSQKYLYQVSHRRINTLYPINTIPGSSLGKYDLYNIKLSRKRMSIFVNFFPIYPSHVAKKTQSYQKSSQYSYKTLKLQFQFPFSRNKSLLNHWVGNSIPSLSQKTTGFFKTLPISNSQNGQEENVLNNLFFEPFWSGDHITNLQEMHTIMCHKLLSFSTKTEQHKNYEVFNPMHSFIKAASALDKYSVFHFFGSSSSHAINSSKDFVYPNYFCSPNSLFFDSQIYKNPKIGLSYLCLYPHFFGKLGSGNLTNNYSYRDFFLNQLKSRFRYTSQPEQDNFKNEQTQLGKKQKLQEDVLYETILKLLASQVNQIISKYSDESASELDSLGDYTKVKFKTFTLPNVLNSIKLPTDNSLHCDNVTIPNEVLAPSLKSAKQILELLEIHFLDKPHRAAFRDVDRANNTRSQFKKTNFKSCFLKLAHPLLDFNSDQFCSYQGSLIEPWLGTNTLCNFVPVRAILPVSIEQNNSNPINPASWRISNISLKIESILDRIPLFSNTESFCNIKFSNWVKNSIYSKINRFLVFNNLISTFKPIIPVERNYQSLKIQKSIEEQKGLIQNSSSLFKKPKGFFEHEPSTENIGTVKLHYDNSPNFKIEKLLRAYFSIKKPLNDTNSVNNFETKSLDNAALPSVDSRELTRMIMQNSLNRLKVPISESILTQGFLSQYSTDSITKEFLEKPLFSDIRSHKRSYDRFSKQLYNKTGSHRTALPFEQINYNCYLLSPRFLINNRLFLKEDQKLILKKADLSSSSSLDLTSNQNKSLNEHYLKLGNDAILKKRQIDKKKRRITKMKKQTRRSQKRTRFYPRPNWLRYRLYSSTVTMRHTESNKIPKKTPIQVYFDSKGFDTLARSPFSQTNYRQKLTNRLVPNFQYDIKLRLANKKPLKRNPFIRTRSISTNLNKTKKEPLYRVITANQMERLKLWKKRTYLSRNSISTITRFKPLPLINNFFTEMQDSKPVLWKSYWMRANTKPYLNKVDKSLKQIRRFYSQKIFNKFFLQESYPLLINPDLNKLFYKKMKNIYIQTKNFNRFCSPVIAIPYKKLLNKNVLNFSGNYNLDKRPLNLDDSSLTDIYPQTLKIWEPRDLETCVNFVRKTPELPNNQNFSRTLSYLNEYNRISARRLKQYITQIRENLTLNGNPKVHSSIISMNITYLNSLFSLKTKSPDKFFTQFNNNNIINGCLKLNSISQLRLYWALTNSGNSIQSSFLGRNNFRSLVDWNNRKNIWVLTKQRQQTKNNKTKRLVSNWKFKLQQILNEPSLITNNKFLTKQTSTDFNMNIKLDPIGLPSWPTINEDTYGLKHDILFDSEQAQNNLVFKNNCCDKNKSQLFASTIYSMPFPTWKVFSSKSLQKTKMEQNKLDNLNHTVKKQLDIRDTNTWSLKTNQFGKFAIDESSIIPFNQKMRLVIPSHFYDENPFINFDHLVSRRSKIHQTRLKNKFSRISEYQPFLSGKSFYWWHNIQTPRLINIVSRNWYLHWTENTNFSNTALLQSPQIYGDTFLTNKNFPNQATKNLSNIVVSDNNEQKTVSLNSLIYSTLQLPSEFQVINNNHNLLNQFYTSNFRISQSYTLSLCIVLFHFCSFITLLSIPSIRAIMKSFLLSIGLFTQLFTSTISIFKFGRTIFSLFGQKRYSRRVPVKLPSTSINIENYFDEFLLPQSLKQKFVMAYNFYGYLTTNYRSHIKNNSLEFNNLVKPPSPSINSKSFPTNKKLTINKHPIKNVKYAEPRVRLFIYLFNRSNISKANIFTIVDRFTRLRVDDKRPIPLQKQQSIFVTNKNTKSMISYSDWNEWRNKNVFADFGFNNSRLTNVLQPIFDYKQQKVVLANICFRQLFYTIMCSIIKFPLSIIYINGFFNIKSTHQVIVSSISNKQNHLGSPKNISSQKEERVISSPLSKDFETRRFSKKARLDDKNLFYQWKRFNKKTVHRKPKNVFFTLGQLQKKPNNLFICPKLVNLSYSSNLKRSLVIRKLYTAITQERLDNWQNWQLFRRLFVNITSKMNILFVLYTLKVDTTLNSWSSALSEKTSLLFAWNKQLGNEFSSFFEKPGLFLVDWFAYLFLVEWVSDISNTVPDSLDIKRSNLPFNQITRLIFGLYPTAFLLEYFKLLFNNIDNNNEITDKSFLNNGYFWFLNTKAKYDMNTMNTFELGTNENLLFDLRDVVTGSTRIDGLWNPVFVNNFEANSIADTTGFTNLPKMVLPTSNTPSFLYTNAALSFLISPFLRRRFSHFYDIFIYLVYQPDSDLLSRQKKGVLFWDIWGDFLTQTVYESNINISELSSVKEEQLKLLENMTTFITTTPSHTESEQLNSKKIQSIENNLQKTGIEKPSLIQQLSLIHQFKQKNKNVRPLVQTQIWRLDDWDTFDLQNSQFKQNAIQWGSQQFLSYAVKSRETELFIDFHQPRSLETVLKGKNGLKNSISSIGSLICQIYSGILTKKVSQNILIVGDSYLSNKLQNNHDLIKPKSTNITSIETNIDSKTLLVQAIAGETELRMITDNAYRYSLVDRGVAVGIKFLRDVFDSLSLQTPCFYLMENIHAIGEHRPFILSDDQSNDGENNQQIHEKNQIVYQLNKHIITHYKKPYKGDLSTSIPTNHLSFQFFQSTSFNRENLGTVSSSRYRSVASKLNSSSPNSSVRSFEVSPDTSFSQKISSRLFKTKSAFVSSPSTSPVSVLNLKATRQNLIKKNVPELPWLTRTGLNSVDNETTMKNLPIYSIRSKVAFLADVALSSLTVKLDMITDLLVIIDSVKTNCGFVVLATTNIPFVLDPALRRPGRFDETLSLSLVPKIESWEINSFSSFNPPRSKTTASSFFSLSKKNGVSADSSRFLNNSAIYPLFTQQLLPSVRNSKIYANTIFEWNSNHFSNPILLSTLSYDGSKHYNFNTPYVHREFVYNDVSARLTADRKKQYYWKLVYFKSYSSKYSFRVSTRENNPFQPFLKTDFALPLLNGKVPKTLRDSIITQKSGSVPNLRNDYSLLAFQLSQQNTVSLIQTLQNGVKTPLNAKNLFFSNKQQNLSKIGRKTTCFFNSSVLFHLQSHSIKPIYFTNQKNKLQDIDFSLNYTHNLMGNTNFNSTLLNCLSPHFSLYASPLALGVIVISFVSSQISELFLSATESQSLNTANCYFALNKPFNRNNHSLFPMISESLTTLVLSFVHKRFFYQRDLLVSHLFDLTNHNCFSESIGSSVMLAFSPQRRYENYQRSLYFSQVNNQTLAGGINDLISTHQKQRFVKRLYNVPIKLSFQSELAKTSKSFLMDTDLPTEKSSSLSFTDSGLLFSRWKSSSFQRPSSFIWFMKNRIFMRHFTYLTNQWSTGQHQEYNPEMSFLSDIDWRYTFFERDACDILLDFPDSDQYYNPRNRRWIGHSTFSTLRNSMRNKYRYNSTSHIRNNSLFDFSLSTKAESDTLPLLQTLPFTDNSGGSNKCLNSQIYTHFVYEAFLKGFIFYEKNREMYDYYLFLVSRTGICSNLTEFEQITGIQRFFIPRYK